MPRVIVLDNLSEDGLKLLHSSGDIDCDVRPGLKGAQLRDTLREYDGAICRSGVKITADVLEGNRRLKVIVRAGAGTDNIDTAAAARMGIVVMNTPGGNTTSTAEHTIAMMMALSRHVHPAYRSLIEGRWDRKRFMGAQLAGKTLGVIGLGRVGQSVAVRAITLQMRVLGYDPFVPESRIKELGIEPCRSIDEILPRVDYLTVHTPLNDQTRNLIGTDQIKRMKKGARVINCARGGICDEAALAEGLKSGHLGGVALDVFTTEPCTASPLFGLPGALCTPHLGASTEEAQTSVAVEAAELLIDFFTSGAIRQAVNVPPLDPRTLASLRPYLNLAYRLGLLMAQLERALPRRCLLRFEGDVAGRDCRLLSAAFAAGLLDHGAEGETSIVNAEILLRDRGVELVQETSPRIGDFRSLITAELDTDKGPRTASATLFGRDIPRLVRMGEFRLETRLEGILLLTTHRDVPGVIGKIGLVCGRHQVNIAYLSVGRRIGQPGGEAMGVFALDSEPPAEALAETLQLEPIIRASVVRLPSADKLPPWLGR
ncbi:MAG TPA: phosphoglycerate dehydrogenase [Planctomycetaceae bacterium]|nr:phosphoglycerate dehydrogenase [Planctomycetaceae bacterium]HIQ21464.1 phosphoglycerate dehydrogenase [Planctomycetota bacterium]